MAWTVGTDSDWDLCGGHSDRVSVMAAPACDSPFLVDLAAALGRQAPWRMKLQCLALVAAPLHGVSSVVCTRPAPFCVDVAEPPSSGLVLCPLVVAPPAFQFYRCHGETCRRMLLFLTCPWVGALRPMPACFQRDVRCVFILEVWV